LPSLLDRVLGRKAVVGSGAYWMEHGPALKSYSRDPSRRIAEALRLYTANDHVYTVESLIGDKFSTVGWHLERDGETVTDDPTARLALNLIGLGSIDPVRFPPIQSRSDRDLLVSRHMGLPGTAFVYLDQLDSAGVPARWWTLTPSRLTPVKGERGTLRGWVVDADRPDGVEPIPLEPDELLVVRLEPDDYGHFGIGKAQAAWRKAGLANSTTAFAEGTFLSGGRKSGMIWPDGVSVEGEAWDEWIRAMRSANEDGSFTRRLTANRFPVGSLLTGQTMSELGVPDISTLAREDIYAIWRVPPSQVGRQEAAGLNSGGRQKYEEAALWQNAIEPRLRRWVEAIQARILDRLGLTYIAETPEFDDDAPRYEIAASAAKVPLMVDERRALVGLDPLDPASYGTLGAAVLIESTLIEISAATASATPETPDAEALPELGQVSAKATLHFEAIHDRLTRTYTPRLRAEVAAALTAQARDLAGRVRANWSQIVAKPNDLQAWWVEDREARRMIGVIEPIVRKLTREVTSKTSATFFAAAKATPIDALVEAYVWQRTGERITGINATTREAVRAIIGDGLRDGLSGGEIANRIEDDLRFSADRAELIARTETALAYNDAAIGTYREFDVAEVQAIDGDEFDAECRERNGQVFPIEEAAGITDHPNGTLDWVPVVKANAPPEEPRPTIHQGSARNGAHPESTAGGRRG
jgi:hypothetical protein